MSQQQGSCEPLPAAHSGSPTAAALLTVEDLHKSYRRKEILHGVNFQVQTGSIAVLLGPNGAGKTTTMRCITGLARPTSGDVRLHDVSIKASDVQSRIGFVPEDPILYRNNTVGEHLEFVGRLHRIANCSRRAGEVMESLAISSLVDRFPGRLSQGERRKLAIAMALISDSKILILDEPFNGLDPEAQVELRLAVERLRNQGVSSLISTHRLQEAQSMADHFLIIREGRVVGNLRVGELDARLTPNQTLEDIYLELVHK